jgi:phenylacetic acid degradation protein
VIPPRHLVAGVPARIVRALTEDDLATKIQGTQLYQNLARRSLATLTQVTPLTVFDPDRARLRVDNPRPERGQVSRESTDKVKSARS